MAGEGPGSPVEPITNISSRSEADEGSLSLSGVDVLPPAAFCDTDNQSMDQWASQQPISGQKPSRAKLSLPLNPQGAANEETCGLSLVASLRLAAIEQERERERERRKVEKRKDESKRGERPGAVPEEREALNSRAEVTKRVEEGKEELEERERHESERKPKERAGREVKKGGRQREATEIGEKQRERKKLRKNTEESEREGKSENNRWKEERERKADERSKKEKPEEKQHTRPGVSVNFNVQKADDSQSKDCPPLREAEVEEIANEGRQPDGDTDLSEHKSAPKRVNTINTISGVRAKTTQSDASSSKTERPHKAVAQTLDNSGPRSSKRAKSECKSVPVWMSTEDEEEVVSESGWEDPGTLPRAELYTDGQGG